MPWTGPWEASVSCTDVLFPGGGGFRLLLLLLLTPSSGLSRLRCVIRAPRRQAGFLTLANPGPLNPTGNPLRDDGPTGVPSLFFPPASLLWRFPSPAGTGLEFRLQPLYWSGKHGCWAPLGDSLPPPGWHRTPGVSSSWCPPSRPSQGHVRHRPALGLSPLPAIFHLTLRLSQDGATSAAVTAQPSANRLVQTVRRRAWVPLPSGTSSGSTFPADAPLPLLPVRAAQPFPKGAQGNGVMKLSAGSDTP